MSIIRRRGICRNSPSFLVILVPNDRPQSQSQTGVAEIHLPGLGWKAKLDKRCSEFIETIERLKYTFPLARPLAADFYSKSLRERLLEIRVILTWLSDPEERLSIQLTDQLSTETKYSVYAKFSLPYDELPNPPPDSLTEKGLPLVVAELEVLMTKTMLLMQSELGTEESQLMPELQKIDATIFALGHLATVWRCLAEQLLDYAEQSYTGSLTEMVLRRSKLLSEQCDYGHYWTS